MISKYKNYILIGALIVVSIFTYWYFSKSDTAITGEVAGTESATVAMSNQVLALLQELKTTAGKINNSLLNDPVFKSLRDGSVIIPAGIPGRPNPFLPLIEPGITPPKAK